MSLQAMQWAFEQDVYPSARKFVLVTLANYADADGFCFPGQGTIAAMTGQDERSVRRHLETLEADGFIHRKHRQRKNGSRKSDGIYVNFNHPTGQSDRIQPDKLAGRPTGQVDRKDNHPTGQSDRIQPDKLTALEPKAFEPKALKPTTTAVEAGQKLSKPQTSTPTARVMELVDAEPAPKPKHELTRLHPTPDTRALPPAKPGPLAQFGKPNPQPKPVPRQPGDGKRPPGCETLPAAREENYMLLAGYFDRPNMTRYPDVLEEWQVSAASWTQFPKPYLEIVLSSARGLRPGVTESGPGFAVLALSNPSSLKIPDDIRAVLAQARAPTPSSPVRNSAPRNPGVWLKGDGTPITVLEWYENGSCLTENGDFVPQMTRAWKPLELETA